MALVSLRQLLDHGAENDYGMPAFNINNMEQIKYSDVKQFKEFLRKEALRRNTSINRLIQNALRAYFKK